MAGFDIFFDVSDPVWDLGIQLCIGVAVMGIMFQFQDRQACLIPGRRIRRRSELQPFLAGTSLPNFSHRRGRAWPSHPRLLTNRAPAETRGYAGQARAWRV